VSPLPRLSYPPRLDLAYQPTPLERLPRLSERLGVEVWCKRDDMTGALTTGNKVRKLEFIAAEAKAQGADFLITCGGIQSNHARATAAIAARLGMGAHLILRGQPAAPEGNLLLDRALGAEVSFVTPEEYKRRDDAFTRVEEELKRRGKKPYSIPEGGSNGVGAWGYIRAVEEIRLQERTLGFTFDAVIHAVGSGGTSAGLILGKRLLGLPARVVGVNVCDDRAYFVQRIQEIGEDLARRYPLVPGAVAEEEIELLDGYVGRGYALSTPDELRAIVGLCREEGVMLDPVYTGKAFRGMCDVLKKDPKALGRRILFLHTGGLFGVFSKSAELAEVL
jgi:D-cysteine desulfhydrase